MHAIVNAIRRHAQDLDAAAGRPQYGVISSVDPVRHLARVTLQPDNVLTGWLEISTPVPGWQLLPAMGMQAVIVPREGDAQNGIIVGYAYSNPNPPPSVPNAIGTGGTVNPTATPATGTEMVMVGPGGTAIRFCEGGGLYIRGNISLDGSLFVNGDVSDRHGSLDRLRQHYDSHTHPDVQNGSESTGTTSEPDAE
jgi:hypothetical protein